MTPNEIEVGKFYLRRDYPNSRYLGIGKRKAGTFGEYMQFTEKNIVCIQSELPYGLGLIFKTPDDTFDTYGSSKEDWNMFYLDPWQKP